MQTVTVTLTCDCGCGKTVDRKGSGWFSIIQPEKPTSLFEAKIERALHFASLECMAKWVTLAATYAPELKKDAFERTRGFRGNLKKEGFPFLYV